MATTAPTTAIGYTQTPTYTQMYLDDEMTPELQWPQSIAVYDQMRKTDSQCASVLRAVTLPVRRTPWRIDPNGARPEVVEFVADNLGLPIVGQQPKTPPRTKDRFSWSEHLRLALLMLPMGHAYFEQLYRVDADGNRAHLRKLEFRPSKTIEDIQVAPDGGLISIKQYWTRTNTSPKPIPVSRLVAYVHEREGGNWLGSSILRSAYKNFLLKERLLRVQAQTIERNGMGIPVYEAAETEASLDAGLSMATKLRAGEAAGSAIPHGAKLRLMGVEGTLPDADPVVRYHDEAIARAVLAHFLNLGTQTGSWALGTTFADFFTLSLQTLAQQIADTATQHIIEDLVDINFGESEPAPRLVFDEIGSRQAATAQAMKLLVDAGLITPDAVLDENLRQQYGLPPADPATATPPPAQAPPSPAPEPEPVPGEGSVAASAGDGGMAGLLSQALSIIAHGMHDQSKHGRKKGLGGALKVDAPKVPSAQPRAVPVPGADTFETARTIGEYVKFDKITLARNASLRSGKPSPEAKAWRARMAEAIKSQRIENDSVVYRGAAFKPGMISQLQPGAIISDRGVTSTDVDRDTAQFYAERRKLKDSSATLAMFEIMVPAGMPGYDANYGEFVFGPDSSMRILATRRTPQGIEVTAELIAPDGA